MGKTVCCGLYFTAFRAFFRGAGIAHFSCGVMLSCDHMHFVRALTAGDACADLQHPELSFMVGKTYTGPLAPPSQSRYSSKLENHK